MASRRSTLPEIVQYGEGVDVRRQAEPEGSALVPLGAPGPNVLRADFQVRLLPDPVVDPMIQRIWGAEFLADPVKSEAVRRVYRVLSEETARMLRSAIVIGRQLNDLRQRISSEEFERGLREGKDVFRGWSRGNISKMMSVAEFVDQRSLPIEIVPQSYTVLYEFTTLDAEAFHRAQEARIFRPDVRRSEVSDFKRRVIDLEPVRIEAPKANTNPELATIENQIRQLRVEMRSLRRRRASLLAEALERSASARTPRKRFKTK
jgi:hypothetical protein